MQRYIDTEKLFKALDDFFEETGRNMLSMEDLFFIVEDLPAEGRLLDADKLHYKSVILDTENGPKKSVVVFAKEIDRSSRAAVTKKETVRSADHKKTVAFTGPRPASLCGYEKAAYKDLVEYLVKYCDGLYKAGYRRFVTGGAQGFDQLVFWAVCRLKTAHTDIENVVFAPYPDQDAKWSATGCFSKEEYGKMRNAADDFVLISEKGPSDGKEARDMLMKRNEALVDDCDLLVGFVPSADRPEGGTGYTLRVADEKGKETARIHYVIKNDTVIAEG